MLRSLVKIILVIQLMFWVSRICAQSTSNRGTDFWVAYTGHIDNKSSRMTLFMTSDVNTNYQVRARGQVISSGMIQANVVTPVFINPNVFDVYIGSSDVKELNKAINVTADKPIALYSVISHNARTGSSLILPTATLGREYFVFSQQSTPIADGSFSQFTVVGVQDHTIIEITPSQSNYLGVRPAKVPFRITLNKGDVYQYQSQYDLTGTLLKTVDGCQAFAVFSGSTWTLFCEDGNTISPSGGDNLYQQLFPVTAWGKNFLTAPFYNTLNGNADMIRIIVAEDNTTVTVNGSTTVANGVALNNPYAKGSIISFFSNKPNYIQASARIAVAQYQTSQTCNSSNPPTSKSITYPGDPEMTILNPMEQTLRDITVYSNLGSVTGVNTNINTYFLNVIAKTAEIESFTLDGNKITERFVEIPNTAYSYAVVDVTNTTPQHRLRSTSGFSAIAYGYGNLESYAYLAGTDLKNLSTNIQFYNLGDGSLPQSSFCLGSSFDVILQLPYITNKITWNLNDGAKIDVENNPVYTITVKDGETYYLYKHSVSSTHLKMVGDFNFKALVVKPLNVECSSSEEEVFGNFAVFSPDFQSSTTQGKACVNTAVTFTNTSPASGGMFSEMKWDFGDGLTSTEEKPTHFYKTDGFKVITLTITSELGCTLSVSKTIEIVKAPISKFETLGSLCVSTPVKFLNKSTTSSVISSKWDFGDQSTSTEVTPFHTYADAKTYTVTLITTSIAGCADTSIVPIVVNPLPEVSFKDPGSCVDDVVLFEGLVKKGNITSWAWNFGDGISNNVEDTKQNPRHKFAQTGVYKITVVATSDVGCDFTYSATISINGANPNASFDIIDKQLLCSDRTVQFKNNSTIGFGNITKIEWIYDYKVGGENVKEVDLEPRSGKIYTHKYETLFADRKYYVVMIAYSGQQCYTSSQPAEIVIHAFPQVNFSNIDALCEDTPAFSLTATVQEGLEGTATYTGKGVSNLGIFNPKEAGVGSWPVSYRFVSAYNCAEQKTITITVNQSPALRMPANANIIRAGQVQLDAIAQGNLLKYKWFPKEGLSSDTIANPIAKPSKTIKYTLTVSSLNCSISGDIIVSVQENPDIPNVFSPNGDGKNDTWRIKNLESFVDASITILNRHGQKVFVSGQYHTPWDGRFNGQDVPVGVYYYIIEPNNGREKFTGSVTVLR